MTEQHRQDSPDMICPDCIDGKVFSEPDIKGRGATATMSWGSHTCPTCKGTGRVPSPDIREEKEDGN